MTFKELVTEIETSPRTWLPALFMKLVLVCTSKRVFVAGGAARMAQEAEKSLADIDLTEKDARAYNSELTELHREMEWLDQHCAFVADGKYNLGPFKRGELRKLAQAGLRADKTGTGLIPGYID